MGLFKHRNKQKPAVALGAGSSTPELAEWIRHKLFRRKRQGIQPDTALIASLTAGCAASTASHDTGGPLQVPVGNCDPQKDNGESSALPSLWDRAYEALKIKDFELVEKYEKLLSRELQDTGASLIRAYVTAADPRVATGSQSNEPSSKPDQASKNLDETENQIDQDLQARRVQLDKIAKDGLQRMDEGKTKYHIAGQEYVVQDQIAQTAALVLWAKEWIGKAIKVSPEASMAFAGVCMILPVLTRPIAADEANLDGFTYVTTRMRYYIALEPLLQPRNRDHSNATIIPGLISEFESNIMDLYQHILEFQFRSVLRFYRRRFGNFGRDLIQHEGWVKLRTKIETLETIVQKDSQQINTSSSRQELENLNQKADKSLETMHDILSVAENQLHVAEQSLQVQKEIAKRMLSKDERKTLQLFRLTKDEKDETYEWYKNRVEDRVEGTCQWFLQHDNFKNWLRQDSGPLLVSADPGCGKSVLAKYLIDVELPRSSTICYFFFKDQDQNTLKQAFCALLHQLFTEKPSLIRHAIPEYSNNGPDFVKVTTSLWKILGNVAQDPETGPVIFVLDALDECNESDFRDLIRMLRQLFHKDPRQLNETKFLVTSRPYEHIVSEFRELVDAFPHIHIPGEESSETISQEVNLVIDSRVEKLAKEKNLKADIKNHLKQRLLEIPHRTYLWVYLVFDFLKSDVFKKTRKGIDSTIDTLPESVNQAYEGILSRSKDQGIVRKVLSIILVATRPLTLAEMNFALNFDASTRSLEELDLEAEDDFEKSLRNWCGLFVSIYHHKVYFLHQTAREFLLPKLALSSMPPSRWNGSITLQQGHLVLVEICVVYLDVVLPDVPEANPKTDSNIDYPVFLDYSATYWPGHFREGDIGQDAIVASLALRLCDPDIKGFSIWTKIYDQSVGYVRRVAGIDRSLNVASILGLEDIVKLQLARSDINADSKNTVDGRTPLSFAAQNGYLAIVKLLLVRDVDPDSKDIYGGIPLSLAAVEEHEAIVQLLLARDVDPDSKDTDGRTPLSFAASNGDEAIIKLLLARDVDPDSKDTDGWTPLSFAALNGHEAILKLLLAKDVDPNSKDTNGRTPLSLAAMKGHEAIIKLLLAKGVDPNSKDTNGRTPLSIAALNGHEAIIKLLLARDVDPDSKDTNRRTPLSLAAEEGHEAIIKLLLARDVDPNSKDIRERSPLYFAIQRGHSAVVRQLLESGADADSIDNFRNTPLSLAVAQGREDIVELLLPRVANPNLKVFVGGRTQPLLSCAIARGDEGIVKLLLTRSDIDVESKDKFGITPLMLAKEGGHERIIKLLEDHLGANPL
jgi:ankyrin repeat protein